jgi:hypothetical protein
LQPPRSPEIAKGHELAIQMLLELEDDEAVSNSCLLEPEYRNCVRGRAYRNIVLEKLQEARKQGAGVEEGFAMVLSDMLAICSEGSLPDSGYYDDLTERGIIQRAAGVELEPY